MIYIVNSTAQVLKDRFLKLLIDTTYLGKALVFMSFIRMILG